ncbi:MAG: chorismate mutase [Parvularculales bacterium]
MGFALLFALCVAIVCLWEMVGLWAETSPVETQMNTGNLDDLALSLDDLRHQIDTLDDEIHQRLMRRTEIVHRVAGLKAHATGGERGLAMRMAREAMIMRRLAARHEGALPVQVIFHLWRTLFAASIIIESGFSVGIYGGGAMPQMRDLAYRIYGGAITPVFYDSAGALMEALTQDSHMMALFPSPDLRAENNDWWCHLADVEENSPRVVARLPFLVRKSLSGEPSFLAVARALYEPSGEDTTLIRIATPKPIKTQESEALFESCELAGRLMAQGVLSGSNNANLVALDGFIPQDDKRLLALGRQGKKLSWLGGFPNPVIVP